MTLVAAFWRYWLNFVEAELKFCVVASLLYIHIKSRIWGHVRNVLTIVPLEPYYTAYHGVTALTQLMLERGRQPFVSLLLLWPYFHKANAQCYPQVLIFRARYICIFETGAFYRFSTPWCIFCAPRGHDEYVIDFVLVWLYFQAALWMYWVLILHYYCCCVYNRFIWYAIKQPFSWWF